MKSFKIDIVIASVFFVLTITFILLAINNRTFFDWIYNRHLNPWSWYIRPVFLIPFCFFAYKHSLAGISITLFCLFTSMFWFQKPELVSKSAETFLQFEKEWLTGEWNIKKSLLAATVPVSFIVLGLAFWKRSLFMGLGVIVLMASGKIVWSVQSAGESGKSILLPAITGLIVCLGLIIYGFKRLERRKNKNL